MSMGCIVCICLQADQHVQSAPGPNCMASVNMHRLPATNDKAGPQMYCRDQDVDAAGCAATAGAATDILALLLGWNRSA